ncbi:ribonuclease J [Thermodesulfobacteriota bacterium]
MMKVIPLGGLGEIGLNMMALEYEKYILVVDAGIMFPNEYMPGVDLVIPDFKYLQENRDKVKAVVLTHGHEDHIGAMPFFLQEFDVPVFGTGFTIGLLKEKLKEHILPHTPELNQIKAGDSTRFGPFEVEYIRVKHSIVDGVALAIDTPEGILVHSGDFKIDPTHVDSQFTDLIRFAHFGAKGVLAFFSDSTNAEKEGFTLSELDVKKTLDGIFRSCEGRVIVATFASNISRVQQVINLALKFDRRVIFNGKSMITNVAIAKEQGFIDIPENLEINERKIGRFPNRNIVIVTTGSQGEPMSALARMARDRHKIIKINEGDTIILSSRFIPGNERAITSIINDLYRLGAHVVYEKVSDIHTSGHARREELKLLLGLLKPKFFIPIHGEYRHLVKHSQLALDMGMSRDNVMVVENGSVLCFENQDCHLNESVSVGRIMVDGKGVGDVGEMVLRDRRRLSGHGIVVILTALDEKTGEVIYGPDIISRGFVFEDQGEKILIEAKKIVLEILEELNQPSPVELNEIESEIQRRLKRFFNRNIERNPLIIPTIIQV